MDQLDLERNDVKTSTDWEESLRLFQNAIARESKSLQVRAILNLAHRSNNAPEDILARTIPILLELLEGPITSSRPPIHVAAVYCLKCIACKGEGKLALTIGQSGAIPSLLRLLPDSNGDFQRVLLKCLRILVMFGDLNRKIVVRNGGLEIILNMLNSFPDGSRRFLLEILSSLALLGEVRRVIISIGGLRFLVECARFGSMISRTRAAQAIGLLGLVKRARRMLVDFGVIPVLVELLQNGDMSTKLVAGNALGVISSHVDYIRPVALAGVIPLYTDLLQGPEPMGKEIAEDVFCILAVSEENAVTISEHLVRILREGDDEAKASASDVLWGLSGNEYTLSVIRNSGAIPILVELLRNGNGDVREKVSGAIAQLSYNEADRIALADAGAIRIIMEMLEDESEEMRDNAAEALVNFSEDPLLRERVSEVFDVPSFRNMQDRLIRIRNSDARLATSMRQMSVEQLTWDPGWNMAQMDEEAFDWWARQSNGHQNITVAFGRFPSHSNVDGEN